MKMVLYTIPFTHLNKGLMMNWVNQQQFSEVGGVKSCEMPCLEREGAGAKDILLGQPSTPPPRPVRRLLPGQGLRAGPQKGSLRGCSLHSPDPHCCKSQ